MDNKKIFLVCTGLGRVNRGYETFTRECFDMLSANETLDMYLFKGKGHGLLKERPILNIHRNHPLAKFIGKVLRKDAYFVEQLTFFLFFLFPIFKHKPKVIFYSDFILGTFLWHLRRKTGLEYKLVFSNGAPNGPPFTRSDLVQQLLPFYREEAVKYGEAPDKHVVLPYAIHVNSFTTESLAESKRLNKAKFGLEAYFVVLCVAAINDSHKRISYLIDEVSSLSRKDVFLIVLGQQDEESSTIISKGKEFLKERFMAKTIGKEEVESYYFAADAFVLPSLKEGLPRVMLEAMSYGLPVFAHDYKVARDVVGKYGYYADFTLEGALSKKLEHYLAEPHVREIARERNQYVHNQFSWVALKEKYVELFNMALR